MIDRRLFWPSPDVGLYQHSTIPTEAITRQMIEALDIKPDQKVLEIGTGSGYQTLCLLDEGAEVYSIELPGGVLPRFADLRPMLPPELVERMDDNLLLLRGDGAKGWPYSVGFDAIMANCSWPRVPEAWVEQLKDGGRVVCPIGDESAIQMVAKYVKKSGKLEFGMVVSYARFQGAQ